MRPARWGSPLGPLGRLRPGGVHILDLVLLAHPLRPPRSRSRRTGRSRSRAARTSAGRSRPRRRACRPRTGAGSRRWPGPCRGGRGRCRRWRCSWRGRPRRLVRLRARRGSRTGWRRSPRRPWARCARASPRSARSRWRRSSAAGPCPGRILPTSDSSTLPLKISSLMSATVAIVVPSLKVLVSMTELPSSTGTSSTVPSMVARTSVFEVCPDALGGAAADQLEVVLRRGHLLLRPCRGPARPAASSVSGTMPSVEELACCASSSRSASSSAISA